MVQIAAFTAQESMHSREHVAFNRQVTANGYEAFVREIKISAGQSTNVYANLVLVGSSSDPAPTATPVPASAPAVGSDPGPAPVPAQQKGKLTVSLSTEKQWVSRDASMGFVYG